MKCLQITHFLLELGAAFTSKHIFMMSSIKLVLIVVM